MVIFASEIRIKVGRRTYKKKDTAWETWLFENCGEGNVDAEGFDGRVDPCLMLYYDRPVIVNTNLDVINGIANGMRAFVVKVELKRYEHACRVKMDDIELPAIRANQIKRIILKHEDENKENQYLFIEPREQKFKCKLPIPTVFQSIEKKEDVRNFRNVMLSIANYL
jgi:hypothetical protein